MLLFAMCSTAAVVDPLMPALVCVCHVTTCLFVAACACSPHGMFVMQKLMAGKLMAGNLAIREGPRKVRRGISSAGRTHRVFVRSSSVPTTARERPFVGPGFR